MRDLVHAFKYRGRADCLEPLGRMMAGSPRLAALWRSSWVGADRDLVVPIPLRTGPSRRRRYNQAEGLARGLAARARLECDGSALVRRRPGPAQAGRSAKRRLRQARGALRARPWRVEGRRVLLVDDVMSTGATADAASRALRLAGATAVHVVTLAT